MPLNQVLAAAGLVRPARRGGFCPACRHLTTGFGDRTGAQSEIATPALVALAVMVVAALAWVLAIQQSRSMAGLSMGLGSVGTFAATWLVMMAAMMLPSATPLAAEFARAARGRQGWRAALSVLGATYLLIWLAFGLACYAIYDALGMPWANQGLVGGVALVLAAGYALTPLKRAGEARCRELCALHGPLPVNLQWGALAMGLRYGISCVGCSAALMVAMVIIGMSNLGWMVVLAGLVLVYKLAPAPRLGARLLLSAAIALLGVSYGMLV